MVPDDSSPWLASSVPSGLPERQIPSSRDLGKVIPNIKGSNKDDTQTNMGGHKRRWVWSSCQNKGSKTEAGQTIRHQRKKYQQINIKLSSESKKGKFAIALPWNRKAVKLRGRTLGERT